MSEYLWEESYYVSDDYAPLVNYYRHGCWWQVRKWASATYYERYLKWTVDYLYFNLEQ